MTRSAFLVRATLATAGTAGAGAVSPFVRRALAQGSQSDVDILNFALTLEFLEADFYERALREVSLSSDVRALTETIAENEAEHVESLSAAIRTLKGKPVEKPRFNFVFGSESSYLETAQILEDTGVEAYNGAAPLIDEKGILAAAGAIVQIEGRHAAAIRRRRGMRPTVGAFDNTKTMPEIRAAIEPFIA